MLITSGKHKPDEVLIWTCQVRFKQIDPWMSMLGASCLLGRVWDVIPLICQHTGSKEPVGGKCVAQKACGACLLATVPIVKHWCPVVTQDCLQGLGSGGGSK